MLLLLQEFIRSIDSGETILDRAIGGLTYDIAVLLDIDILTIEFYEGIWLLLPTGQTASEELIKTTLMTFGAVTEHPSLLMTHRLTVSLTGI